MSRTVPLPQAQLRSLSDFRNASSRVSSLVETCRKAQQEADDNARMVEELKAERDELREARDAANQKVKELEEQLLEAHSEMMAMELGQEQSEPVPVPVQLESVPPPVPPKPAKPAHPWNGRSLIPILTSRLRRKHPDTGPAHALIVVSGLIDSLLRQRKHIASLSRTKPQVTANEVVYNRGVKRTYPSDLAMSDTSSVTSDAPEMRASKRKYPYTDASSDLEKAHASTRDHLITYAATSSSCAKNAIIESRSAKRSALPSSTVGNLPGTEKQSSMSRGAKQKPLKPLSTVPAAESATAITFWKHLFEKINTNSEKDLLALVKDPRLFSAASNPHTIFPALDQVWRPLITRPYLTKRHRESCSTPFFQTLPVSPLLPIPERSIIRLVLFLNCVIPAARPDCTVLSVVVADIRTYLLNADMTKKNFPHLCRALRAAVAWCRFVRDQQSVRQLCCEIVAKAGAAVETLYMLDTVGKIWDEPLRNLDAAAARDGGDDDDDARAAMAMAVRAMRRTVSAAFANATKEDCDRFGAGAAGRLRDD
ncbi:hypothetical protein HDU87_002679 [Geranomyces variabilis]|uniref:Uncharacterized protein n=1 Tax=Geranomyces variabilis TaxID=109894 RepID=A0AAD5TWA6_9FUNG|nr:hypothetical protein HDU87_002679 [Geranomyces variabilis]